MYFDGCILIIVDPFSPLFFCLFHGGLNCLFFQSSLPRRKINTIFYLHKGFGVLVLYKIALEYCFGLIQPSSPIQYSVFKSTLECFGEIEMHNFFIQQKSSWHWFLSSCNIFFTDLLSGIRKAAEAGRLPLNVIQGLDELYQNYRNAVN